MGKAVSKPFPELTVEELAAAVNSLGAKYGLYTERVVENGVDGALLSSLTEDEFEETLEDMDVSNRLHRRVLIKEWKKTMLTQTPTTTAHDVPAEVTVVPQQETRRKSSRSKKSLRRVDEYDFDTSTPKSELRPYDDITQELLESDEASVIHAVTLVVEEGQLALSTKVRTDGKIDTTQLHSGPDTSICHMLLHDGTDRSFYAIDLKEQKHFPRPPHLRATYTGFAIRNESGKRIGMVCVADLLPVEELDLKKRKAMLRKLAEHASYQLQLRKALVRRRSKLEKEVLRLETKTDQVVLPASGPVKEVTSAQASTRLSNEIASPAHHPSPLDIPSSSPANNTQALPIFSPQNLASKAETAHLQEDLFSVANELGVPRPPVAKNDMDRIANSAALGLIDLKPGSELAVQLKEYVNMAVKLFGFSAAEINIQVGSEQIAIVSATGYNKALDEALMGYSEVIAYEDEERKIPFQTKVSRSNSVCNYTYASGRTFVVHDVTKDETFQWLGKISPVRSYAGTPIRASNGQVIGVMCMVDDKPRPDFRAAHEIQLEQIGNLILRSIENWILRRDVERLEDDRIRLSSITDKSSPPTGKATIVVANIDGLADMSNENPDVIGEAREIHDGIVRRLCVQHDGYEMDCGMTDGGCSFAFHEPLDAVAFALDAQTALFEAPWPLPLLSFRQAREENSAFRGLRLCMGIHEGDIEMSDDDVNATAHLVYEGEAIRMAKALLATGHGGQILLSLSTWNLTEFFAETALDCPQVLDLGGHILPINVESMREGVIRQRIIQLVPKSLEFDYFALRKSDKLQHELLEPKSVAKTDLLRITEVSSPTKSGLVKGRQFGRLKSIKVVSPSFHDAPYERNEVTIAFVNVSEIEQHFDDAGVLVSTVIQLVQSCIESVGFGYQCQNDMLAFRTPSEAIRFGLHLRDMLDERPMTEGFSLSQFIRYGCVHDVFLTMGPHKTTGRADYFGKVVNRAARITNAGELGAICYGVVGKEALQRSLHHTIRADFLGMRVLKGVPDEMACYECRWRNKNT